MAPHLALLTLALTAVSPSRLGVVVRGDDGASRALLAQCPRLAVFPLPSASAAAQIADYRRACPEGQVVLQVGGDELAVDASTASASWFSEWLLQVQVTVPDAHQVDGVEGPRNPVATAATLLGFWSTFAEVVSQSGYVPVVGASAPALRERLPAPTGGTEDAFCAVARAVRSAVPAFAWSDRSASATLTTDAQTEASTSLAYRSLADECGLARDRLFITAVEPPRPWRAGDVAWLTWLDGQLTADAARLDLRGAAVSEAGAPGSSDLTPIAAALAAYLAQPQPPDGGAGDGGTGDGGSGDGGSSGVVQPTVPSGGPLVDGQPRSCSCGSPVLGGAILAAALLRRRGADRRGGRGRHQGVKR